MRLATHPQPRKCFQTLTRVLRSLAAGTLGHSGRFVCFACFDGLATPDLRVRLVLANSIRARVIRPSAVLLFDVLDFEFHADFHDLRARNLKVCAWTLGVVMHEREKLFAPARQTWAS